MNRHVPYRRMLPEWYMNAWRVSWCYNTWCRDNLGLSREGSMSIGYSTGAARRVTWTLFATQSLASAALIANGTVNPIVGKELSGRDALGGVPGTLLLLGAAGAAYPA